MARSILEILIQAKDQASGAFRGVTREAGLMERGIGALNKVLGAFGIALGVQKTLEWGDALSRAGRESTDARNRLVDYLGSIEKYNEFVEEAQRATRGMVSESDLASGAFILLEQNLAKNAQEAAKLANAGNVLSQAFASSGASVELFNRFLSTGSRVLADNFAISNVQIDTLAAQKQATEGLSKEEARLAAIRELAIEKADRLSKTMSEGTVEAAQYQATLEDLAGTIGELLNPAMEDARGLNTSFIATLLGLASALKTNRDDLVQMQESLIANSDSIEEYRENMADAVDGNVELMRVLNLTTEEFIAMKQEMVTGSIAAKGGLTDIGIAAEHLAIQMAKVASLTNEGREAFERLQSAAAGRTAAQDFLGGLEATQGPLTIEERAQAEEDANRRREQEQKDSSRRMKRIIEDAAKELGNTISGAVSGAIGSATSFVEQALGLDEERQDEAGESLRRMAAVATGGLGNEWTQLLAQELEGVDAAQAFVAAVQNQDDAAVREEAKKLVANPIIELFDATVIADEVERVMREQQLADQLNDRVSAVLAERGIDADSGLVAQILGDPAPATQAAVTSIDTVGSAAQNMASNTGTAFTEMTASAEIFRQKLVIVLGIIQNIGRDAEAAAEAIQNVGSSAGVNGNTASETQQQNQMGGMTRP